MKVKASLIAFALLVLTSCQKKEEPIVVTAEEFHQSVDQVVEIMIHDIFSPPVASRIFAYPNIAAYEIIAKKNDNYKSLAGQVTELTSIPDPKSTENVNYDLAALIAHIDLSKRLIFSEERLENYRDSLYTVWANQNESEFNASKEYGLQVADYIAAWMNKDNYKETRTMPKFTVDSEDPTRWQPTPPAYMNGIEPHWSKIRPFALDSAAQFKPIPPPSFSLDKDSQFFKEVMEVYEVKKSMIGKGDKSDEIAIAQFWDCNPYVSVTRGHLMFATKKITPGAHWIGITKIACRNVDADFDKTVYAYTKTSIAIADAFISCWDEKYRSNLIRPETVINEYIDDSWEPVLQTPPFPEYTSGHSVVSGAASTALTDVFGDDFAFEDDTELPYGLPIRTFKSFRQAADEAAISRMYGGIHYRAAIEVGIKQGRDLGKFIVDKLDMTKG
ncbi:vanadium-dependent haloperoxidase [Flagellimonas aequoris]|uniref:Phosphatase PAP2 family protein n=1 Tax=Flagellimonas aequoris TaxID=2306997 RepID=A0A418N6Y4_9FLAO|nr:vanadium-dependent haloperoxidase [Allomuricauda aequoris]RIV70642.1 phosphatase PAP2 family protein [Allomuricauda aequoris]TXK02077.1 vanadium-dependent haloperoxidase [Allomuricauda aequoris]